jgi:hypothetical protein
MRKRPKKLKLALETLRTLTPPVLEGAVGGVSAATNCFTCFTCGGDSCRSDCGSCGNCTQYPCPVTNALTCICG